MIAMRKTAGAKLRNGPLHALSSRAQAHSTSTPVKAAVAQVRSHQKNWGKQSSVLLSRDCWFKPEKRSTYLLRI